MRGSALAILLLGFPGAALRAQPDLPSDVTFEVRRALLEELLNGGPSGQAVGARWTIRLFMQGRSDVHLLSADCELHVGARLPNNRIVATPNGIVIEPPNVCKLRVPQIPQGGSIRIAWHGFFDQRVIGRSCDVTGFPRLFSEHASGGEEGGSNPDHVVEIHPVTGLVCGNDRIDFLPMLTVFPGMRAITEASAIACLGDRRLFVRQRGSDPAIRYEFKEEGAKGGQGRCGNFVIVDAHIAKDHVRTLTNGGDHVALARAWVGDAGPFPLRIYTYSGTTADAKVSALLADGDPGASLSLPLHGLLTYDYFTIIRALQVFDPATSLFRWAPAADLASFREIPSPLALVVFGLAAVP